ncbi:hypothetical protein ABZ682_22670 [Streptomyces griseoviridis]|uniref:helix-turn-helix domain-containing protein n=1 Tax=Streptomyces griseoviridis TaxID=45398 RepID=UPI0033E2D9C6
MISTRQLRKRGEERAAYAGSSIRALSDRTGYAYGTVRNLLLSVGTAFRRPAPPEGGRPVSFDPPDAWTLAGLGAAAILVGAVAAACQHQDGDPATTSACVDTAYAAPAAPTRAAKTGSFSLDPPRARLSKTPRQATSAAVHESPWASAVARPTVTKSGHGPHVDIDLDDC